MQHHLRAHTLRILISLLGLSILFPLASSAQDANDEELVLEEVLVTASKREVSLQDLGASIKAFTMENLESINADTFTDYARLTPSLSFAERGSQRNRIVIRGLGPSTGLPTTGVYIDGVPAQQSFETWDPRLFDIERIEILRGPQGTLYGEGSLGGTINIISARPNLSQVEGKVAAEYGSIRYGEHIRNFSGMINVPLVEDTFGIRGVILSRDQGGFIDYPLADNFNGVENGNSDKAIDARVIARWQPNDRFTISALYYYQDAKIEFDQAISPAFTEAIGRGDDLVSNQTFQTEWDWTTKQGTLELDYDFDFADLVATFGTIDRKRSLVDSLLGPAYIDQDERVKSGEVRLVSKTGNALEWIIGVYYRDNQSDIFADLPGVAAAFGLPAFLQEFNVGREAWAIYGEMYYSFTDQWRVTAGARYFDEDVTTFSGQDFGIPGFESAAEVKNNFSNVSPKLALEFRPGESTLIYASASQGFRSGGNNVDIVADPNFQDFYDEDKVTAYELGWKQSAAGGRVTFNTALFYNDWDDIQIDGIPGNSSLGFITNGGKAHSKGIEADFAWIPLEGLEITAGGALIEAETDEPMQGGPEGSKLENVPKSMFNASISYTWNLFSDWYTTIYGDYSYRGESFGAIPNSDFNRAAPYSLANARLSFNNGAWDVMFYVENIFDERGTSFSFSDQIGITDQVFIIRPRTYGVRLQFAFAR